jgi:hypothetical protein
MSSHQVLQHLKPTTSLSLPLRSLLSLKAGLVDASFYANLKPNRNYFQLQERFDGPKKTEPGLEMASGVKPLSVSFLTNHIPLIPSSLNFLECSCLTLFFHRPEQWLQVSPGLCS